VPADKRDCVSATGPIFRLGQKCGAKEKKSVWLQTKKRQRNPRSKKEKQKKINQKSKAQHVKQKKRGKKRKKARSDARPNRFGKTLAAAGQDFFAIIFLFLRLVDSVFVLIFPTKSPKKFTTDRPDLRL